MIDDFTIARVLHVLAVLFWIGGVAFVTTALMPGIRRAHAPGERLEMFHRVEGRFAPQARWWVLLAGASGFWMAWRGQMFGRFLDPGYWWMHAMVAVWAFFMLMLFVLEPLVLHRRMADSPDPERDFDRMERMHRVLLAAAVVTFIGAAAGSHGLI